MHRCSVPKLRWKSDRPIRMVTAPRFAHTVTPQRQASPSLSILAPGFSETLSIWPHRKKVKCLIGTLNFVHRGRRGGVGAAWVVASCHDGDILVNPQRQWLLGRSSMSPENCVCECQMSPGEPAVNCVCFALVWPHRRGIGGQGVKTRLCIHGACALWTSVDH